MKRIALSCTILCLMILLSTSAMSPTRASINSFNWIGAIIKNGYDSFFGTYVTAYEVDSTAELVVNVYNDYWWADQVNISAVIVGFDWGINYSSDEVSLDEPYQLPIYESHVFMIDFTVPSTSVASNLVTHSYTVYVEHVNNTIPINQTLVDTWTANGWDFAVLSTDQGEAYETKRELDAYPSPFSGIFLTAHARELLTMAQVEESMGHTAYSAGKFATARDHYQNALDFTQQAWSNETEKWIVFEDALAGLLQGGQTLLTMQGYAWLIFGIGFLLMGIGVLIYLARKSGTSRGPPT